MSGQQEILNRNLQSHSLVFFKGARIAVVRGQQEEFETLNPSVFLSWV